MRRAESTVEATPPELRPAPLKLPGCSLFYHAIRKPSRSLAFFSAPGYARMQ